MSTPPDLKNAFAEWGKQAFAEEVELGFSRAKIFNAPVNRVIWLALEEFSKAQLLLLGRILPAGPVSEKREQLTDEEKQLTDALVATVKRIWQARQEEICGPEEARIFTPAGREEAKKIRRLASGIFKEIAREWKYEIHKEEPAVWLLTSVEKWGSISVDFDLHERMEFSCAVGFAGPLFTGLPRRESYLGRLGLSPKSSCMVTDASTCAGQFRQVAGLIHWQLEAYTRIIESLVKPGDVVNRSKEPELREKSFPATSLPGTNSLMDSRKQNCLPPASR
jgi:hypothetical protein